MEMWDILGNFGSLLEGIVGLLTLGTILLVLKQTREMQKQNSLASKANLTDAYQDVTEIMRDIEKIFIQNPSWKPYFYEDKSIAPKHRDYGKLITLAEMYVDYMDLVMLHRIVTSSSSDEISQYITSKWDGWLKYFKYIFEHSPVVRDYWREYYWWYPEDLHKLLGTPTNSKAVDKIR